MCRNAGMWYRSMRNIKRKRIIPLLIILVCLIIAARQSLEERRPVIDRRLAVLFGAASFILILIAAFLIIKAGAVWWGVGIAVIIGAGLFARDLAEKITEIARRAKAQRVPTERQKPAAGKNHEK